ncbi:MAG: hypothetical protein AAF367_01190 [Pseudomonadota bacterium]
MTTAYVQTTLRPATRAELRRKAFEANLTANLKEVIGAEIHPANLAKLVRMLGHAHMDVHHLIEARTTLGFGRFRYYVVLQSGFAPKHGKLRNSGPLAASVISRMPPDTLDVFSSVEQERIADCIDRAEITRVHAVDWRPRATVRIAQFYINLLAGKDRRSRGALVSHERRAPADEGFGAVILMMLFVAFAGVGLWLTVAVIGQLWTIISNDTVRAVLFGS